MTRFPSESILGVLDFPVLSSSSATIGWHVCRDDAKCTVVLLSNALTPLAVENRCERQFTILALSFSVKLQRETRSSADPLSIIHVLL